MSQNSAKNNTFVSPTGSAGGDLSGTYPNPTVAKLQGNAVSAISPTDGYVLTWDATDGYWHAAPGGATAVIFDSGTPSENVVTVRSTTQSPTTNTFQGIVNLSSDTTQATVGADANFATISGGDQNVISGGLGSIGGGLANTIYTNTGYATISGGWDNTIGTNSNSSNIGGGQQNTIYANSPYSTIGGGVVNGMSGTAGVIAGGNNNTASGDYPVVGGGALNTAGGAVGYDSVLGGFSNTASGGYSVALGYMAKAYSPGQFAHSSGTIFNTGDNQASSLVYSAQSLNTTPVTLQDATAGELILPNGFAFIIRARVIASRQDSAMAPASFEHILTVHTTGGALTIDSDYTTPQSATPGTDPTFDNGAGWTVAFTASVLTLSCTLTGAAAQTVNASLHYDMVECIGTGA